MTLYDPAFVKLQELLQDVENMEIPDRVKSKLKDIEGLILARDEYSQKQSSSTSPEVFDLIKETMEHPWEKAYKENKTTLNINPSMVSGEAEGKILQFIIRCSHVKRVLEIGTFTGCGALMMAESLPNDGVVITCELDQYIADLARTQVDKSPHGRKITIKVGYALDILRTLANEGQKFDMIFIDADRKGYLEYFKMSINELLTPKGIVCVDNALLYGSTYTTEPRLEYGDCMVQLNNYIATRRDIFHVLLPTKDGMMLIEKIE